MTKWSMQKIGDLSEYVTVGFVGTMSHLFTEDGVPLLRGQNVLPYKLDWHDVKYISKETHLKWGKSALQPGDVAIVRVGYPGTACVIPKEIGDLNAASLVIVRPNKNLLNPNFLCFVLNSPWGKGKIKGQLVGAAQQVFNTNDASALEIFTPSIDIQKKISDALQTYNSLIENNGRRIEVLENMAQRLYTEWFVKFKFPGHEKVKMVDSGTEYGMIPQGWRVSSLSDVSKIVRGCSYSTEEIDDNVGDYYIVNLKSFNRGGGFRFDGKKYYSGSINNNQILTTGDIVIAVTDMTTDRAVIARPARIPEIDGKLTFSADVVKIDSNTLPNSYLYQLLSSYRFTETTKQMANGANVLHLKPSAILEFVTVIPDTQLLNSFDVLCEPVAREIDKLLKQNDNLSKTRDLLIPQLITGRRALK